MQKMQRSPDTSQPAPADPPPPCRRRLPSLHAALLLFPWSADPVWLACHAQHVRDIVAADAAEEVRSPDGRRMPSLPRAVPALMPSRTTLLNSCFDCCHCCRATTSCSTEVGAGQLQTQPLCVRKGACGNMPAHKARSRHHFHPLQSKPIHPLQSKPIHPLLLLRLHHRGVGGSGPLLLLPGPGALRWWVGAAADAH